MQNREITIKVGNTEFSCNFATLTNNQDYLFHELAQNITNNYLFIDRNPMSFSVILDHLRGYNISYAVDKMSQEELEYLTRDIIYYKLFDLIKYLPRQGLKYLKEQNINLAHHGTYFTKFDPNFCSANAQLLNDGDRVRKHQGGVAHNCGVLGSEGCYNYKIRIINGGASNYLHIGFAIKSSFQINGSNFTSHGWYLYYGGASLYSQSGHSNSFYANGGYTPKNGTVIEAIYNPNDRTISFKVDGVSFGIAYSHIVAPVDFCPAFDIHDPNTEFEFI